MRRAARRRRHGNSPAGWGLFPLALILLLLVLAPVLAHGQSADSVVVRWTAPGDDGAVGTAERYDLRVSNLPIDAGNFESAAAVTGMPAPLAAGSRQTITVRNLVRGTVYYFALRTRDDAGNWSPVSNLVRWDWILDTAPPAAPAGMTATVDEGTVRVQWTPSAEPDVAGYRVYRAVQSDGPFVLVSGGTITANEWVEPMPDRVPVAYYEVTAIDASGNESARSARAIATLTSTNATAELKVEGSYPNPSRIDGPVTIPVIVPASGVTDAWVEILDSGRRRVRRIEIGTMAAGRRDVTWDGKNDANQTCAPGVYRGWLHTNQGRQAIRIVRVP
jgi:hypothetical protein